MLFRRLKVSGLLSFGPTGIDLEMKPLNVLIGPNGSGKSNLLDILAVLKSAPSEFFDPILLGGGTQAWRWKPDRPLLDNPFPAYDALVQVDIFDRHPDVHVVHEIHLNMLGLKPEIQLEHIRTEVGGGAPQVHYVNQFGSGEFRPRKNVVRPVRAESHRSVLAQFKDPLKLREFGALQRAYSGINLHRNWTFGPRAPLRTAPRADERFDVLQDGGGNLALVISNFPPPVKRRLVESLRELIDGVQGIDTPARAGIVDLFLDEGDDRQIPASRLSDGTLRYLSLLAILLNPEPPPLVAIEEPELGLHPDVIPHIAKLLVEASSRMQLVVTTHSRMLVDCLNETPESVVVCERVDGESQFRRLDPEVMKHWLDKYSLGELWSDGVIGGNRW